MKYCCRKPWKSCRHSYPLQPSGSQICRTSKDVTCSRMLASCIKSTVGAQSTGRSTVALCTVTEGNSTRKSLNSLSASPRAIILSIVRASTVPLSGSLACKATSAHQQAKRRCDVDTEAARFSFFSLGLAMQVSESSIQQVLIPRRLSFANALGNSLAYDNDGSFMIMS